MKKQRAKEQLSKFIRKQRNERYAFGWQQHQELLNFKEAQINERQEFISKLQGGSQC